MLCGQHFKWSLYLNFAWSASFPESVLEIIANLCGPQVVVLTLPCKHCCGQCGVWSQHRRCWPAFFKNAKVSTRVESVSECFLRLRFQGTFYQLYTSVCVWGGGRGLMKRWTSYCQPPVSENHSSEVYVWLLVYELLHIHQILHMPKQYVNPKTV